MHDGSTNAPVRRRGAACQVCASGQVCSASDACIPRRALPAHATCCNGTSCESRAIQSAASCGSVNASLVARGVGDAVTARASGACVPL